MTTTPQYPPDMVNEPSRLVRLLNYLRPHFEIKGDDGSIYLRRWALIRLGPLRVNLHQILRSDSDRFLHDHPWNFTSIILRNGYIEQSGPIDNFEFETFLGGEILHRKAEWAHRLIIDPRRPAWTLVFLGRSRRVWGFHTNEGWKPWREHLGLSQSTMEQGENE